MQSSILWRPTNMTFEFEKLVLGTKFRKWHPDDWTPEHVKISDELENNAIEVKNDQLISIPKAQLCIYLG